MSQKLGILDITFIYLKIISQKISWVMWQKMDIYLPTPVWTGATVKVLRFRAISRNPLDFGPHSGKVGRSIIVEPGGADIPRHVVDHCKVTLKMAGKSTSEIKYDVDMWRNATNAEKSERDFPIPTQNEIWMIRVFTILCSYIGWHQPVRSRSFFEGLEPRSP